MGTREELSFEETLKRSPNLFSKDLFKDMRCGNLNSEE